MKVKKTIKTEEKMFPWAYVFIIKVMLSPFKRILPKKIERRISATRNFKMWKQKYKWEGNG